ncbi:ribonuclease J [Ferruginivarius sediminum]|uniref:Ribonuclease J n=1 Tax=Ferruginivarius sediminum TaxID=2661937 RepID=A0A369TDB4_9PROT|nr:ribonuclease J [Ferruginivarius sediminum]RDD62147.1 ribonuclease J [Ferruginivarius sediminum]
MQITPSADELLFVPLGGTGEIGMNSYLYGHDGQWLMVDLGVAFADERLPGIDLLLPDPAFIAEQREKLAGLVITHAHEDHLGAIPYLWNRLRCPVYATPFASAVLRRKFEEFGLLGEVELIELPVGGSFDIGPFGLEFITLTHSIPEANALLLRTKAGTVFHSGDWKLDPDPLVGAGYDRERLARLAEEDILALVGDSTNALVPGHSGSEADVRTSLMDLAGTLKNRIAVTCFATNVARLETVAQVAHAHGRRVVLAGRAMHNIVRAAKEVGYLEDFPPTVDERDAGYLPREEVMLLVTGSQGEPRSALARIARNDHPEIALEKDDAVIFSSRIIPGNEKAIHALQNQLLAAGIEVWTEEDHFVHVSGHPCRAELEQMYHWVRPRLAVPMHGERRHLMAHAKLAQSCQVPHVFVPSDGQCVRLTRDGAQVVGEVPTGRLAVDGGAIVPVDHGAVRERRKVSFQGAAVLTLVVDREGRLEGEPLLTVYGLFGDDEAGWRMAEAAIDAVEKSVGRLKHREKHNDDVVRETARLAVRRSLHRDTGRKPVTDVHLVRLD